MTAWEDGRSTVTGTRRSLSQGEAILAVTSASTQTRQLDSGAPSADASPRWTTSRCTVSAQKTAMAVQPPNRCVSSNRLCARVLTAGAAHTTTITASAARQYARTTVTRGTLAGSRVRATVATQVKAQSHAVPASAAPAWIPPMWCTLDTL